MGFVVVGNAHPTGEMDAYAKLSKGTDTGYNLFLYGGYLQTAKDPGDSGGQANAARSG